MNIDVVGTNTYITLLNVFKTKPPENVKSNKYSMKFAINANREQIDTKHKVVIM